MILLANRLGEGHSTLFLTFLKAHASLLDWRAH